MTERPIIFSGPMVQKLLAGEKTQTRRIIKKHPLIDADFTDEFVKMPENHVADDCPYGKPGDVLWVRETVANMNYPGDPHGPLWTYRADTPPTSAEGWALPPGVKWRPAIHMPRAACRLKLRITDVRVQRLMDITNEDARAEGFKGWDSQAEGPKVDIGEGFTIQQCGEYVSDSGAFLIFWDKLHGDGATYDNPWVWALTFEVLQGRAPVAREPHKLEVGGSIPSPATITG